VRDVMIKVMNELHSHTPLCRHDACFYEETPIVFCWSLLVWKLPSKQIDLSNKTKMIWISPVAKQKQSSSQKDVDMCRCKKA